MWYNRRYEKTHFYPTFDRRRTAPDPGRTAFVRCLCDASLPDLASIGAWGTSPSDSPPAGLRRPDRAQCDPRFNATGLAVLQRRLFAPPSAANQLLGGWAGRLKDLLHRSPRDFGKERGVDLGVGSPGQLRARHHRHPDLRRKRAPRAQTLENQLEACQTLDHQPRSAVPAKKNARDRLIAWASQQPTGRLALAMKSGGAALRLPQMHAWQSQDQPVRLVEQSWRKDDPDPKALACYGVLWQQGTPDEPDRRRAGCAS